MNKARRNEISFLKYKKRIRRFCYNLDYYISKDGRKIHKAKTIDVLKDNGQHGYRTTSTPCSCIMCSPYKYNRAKEKVKIQKEITTCIYQPK